MTDNKNESHLRNRNIIGTIVIARPCITTFRSLTATFSIVDASMSADLALKLVLDTVLVFVAYVMTTVHGKPRSEKSFYSNSLFDQLQPIRPRFTRSNLVIAESSERIRFL